MATAAIMFQGTGSDVGKSLIVAGLARAFTRRQLRVRPFKPQNMSNNAAVTRKAPEGCPERTNGRAAISATSDPRYPAAKPYPETRPRRSGGAISGSQAL